MIRYEFTRQLTIEEFQTPFQTGLLPENRWLKLVEVGSWVKFASIYINMRNKSFGRPAVSPRIVLGALIIRHIEKLDDRGVVDAIQENPYMQFSIGLREFDPQPFFDPSLFLEIRKRIGHEAFDSITVYLNGKKEALERNHIEAKFGQRKNGYNLNKIRAKLKETSRSWIACLFFLMNLVQMEHKYILARFLRSGINFYPGFLANYIYFGISGRPNRFTQNIMLNF